MFAFLMRHPADYDDVSQMSDLVYFITKFISPRAFGESSF